MKPVTKKVLKVLTIATLSLGILASTVESLTASATTYQFRTDSYKINDKNAKKTAKAIQKETKNFTEKQRVNYYNKVLDKIVKESNKKETKELRILAIFHGIEDVLSWNEGAGTKPKNYKNYYHKDPGVYAINAGFSDSKGYAYALRAALKKAGFKSDILSYTDDYGTKYWNVIKLDGKYYHMNAFNSDNKDVPKNNDEFLINGKTLKNMYVGFKLRKPYTSSDFKYQGFWYLDSSRILKESKKYFYSMAGGYAVTKVNKTGAVGKNIYEVPDGYTFVAEKNGWIYGFSHWQDRYFFKIHIEDIASEDSNRMKLIKVADTHQDKHYEYILNDKTITFYDKTNKKVTYTLGK